MFSHLFVGTCAGLRETLCQMKDIKGGKNISILVFTWKCGCGTDPSLCFWRWVGSQPKPVNFWLIGVRALARETVQVTGVQCFVSSGSGQKIGSEPVPAFEETFLRNALRDRVLAAK